MASAIRVPAAAPARNAACRVRGMTTATPHTVVDPHAIVQPLIDGCRSSAQSYWQSARRAHSEELRAVLDERAEQCAEAARKLDMELARASGEPAPHSQGDIGLLEECERIEMQTRSRYADALGAKLPSELHAVLHKQMDGMERHRAQFQELRARLAADG